MPHSRASLLTEERQCAAVSDGGSVQEEEDTSDEAPAALRMPGVVALRTAFLLWTGWISWMRCGPQFLRGNCRIAVRTALEEICAGHRSRETVREERGWKLFLLLSRMLLHRPARRQRKSWKSK